MPLQHSSLGETSKKKMRDMGTQSVAIPKIDEEFRDLLPQLDKETYQALEANLIENGCRDALVVWAGHDILIDGHHRLSICLKHDIAFKTVEIEFDSREEAKVWIIELQVSRRNLPPIQMSYYRGAHYITDRKIITNREGRNQFTEVGTQNESQPLGNRTAARLGEKYKVSRATINRDAKLSEGIDALGRVSPEARRLVLAGDSNVSKKELQELSSLPVKEIKKIAKMIEQGNYQSGTVTAAVATVNMELAASSPLDSATGASIGSGPLPTDTTMVQSIVTSVTQQNASFSHEWELLVARNDHQKMRSSLRKHISELEALETQLVSL